MHFQIIQMSLKSNSIYNDCSQCSQQIINFNLIVVFFIVNSNHKVKIYDHIFYVAKKDHNKYEIKQTKFIIIDCQYP